VKSKHFVNAALSLVILCAISRSGRAESSAGKPTPRPTVQEALDLYYHNDLQGSYSLFRGISSKALAEADWVEGYQAEWWMGLIQERLGNLDVAHEHYEQSLMFMHEAPQRESWRAQREALGMLPSLMRVCQWEGKMGCAFTTQAESERLFSSFWTQMQNAKAKSGVDYHHFALNRGTFGTSRYLAFTIVERARWLQRTGQFDEAEENLKALAAEIEMQWKEWLAEYHGYPPMVGLRNDVPWQDQDLGDLWWELGRQYAFLERLDEAVVIGAKMEAVPAEHRHVETGWLQVTDYASWLAQRDGVSQRVWDVFNPALKQYETSLQYYASWMQARITKADLLAQDGQTETALALLNKLIPSIREKQHADLLAQALKSRAKYRISVGDVQPVADDLKESLALYRTLGDKVKEVELYELYARWLGAEGRHAEALQTWEDAYQMCETLRLHFRSLHMLLGMAELQLRVGNKAELARIWERINKFVVAHKQLPEPTQLRLQLARMDYLKFQGDQQILQAAYNQTIAFVRASSLTSYQARSLKSYDLGQPIAIGMIGTQAEVAVDLQPVMMTTQVSTGELAHARFGIFNPSARTARGSVKLLSADTRFEWTPTDQGWKVALSHGTGEIPGATKGITIPPGSASALYFEALPSTSGTTNRLSITWQGESSAEAKWEFSVSPDSRTVAIVNASLAADNPFYAVPFYHEMYFRGANQELRNFRVKTSEPCRVEILDAATDKLLAIDADGDGNFDGPGDVLYVDEDGNGFPEFVMSKERDIASFELLVYPAPRTDHSQGEIEISLLIEENHAWVEQAVDKLMMK
jgi:tetratricopeptide (TPR) repeat protein